MGSDTEAPLVPIGDVCEIFDGPHATPKKTDTGPLFLSISSLKGGHLDVSESAHLSEEDFQRWTRRVTPQAGDVVFSYETRLGEAALIPEGLRCCLGRRMGLLRPDRSRVLPEYLLYAYLSPEFQGVIRRRTIQGSTVNRILLTELGEFPIRIPPLESQRAVVEVVRPLERLADNCADRVDTIQQLSQTLVARTQSDTHEGEIRTLLECADWYSGGTPRTKNEDYWNGEIPWLSAKSLDSFYIRNSERNVTELGADNGTTVVDAGAVLILVRGMSLKKEIKHGVAVRKIAFSQDVKALVPKNGVDPWFLGYAVRALEPQLLRIVDEAGHGTGRLPTDRLEKVVVRFPPHQEYCELVAVLDSLNSQAASLLAQRETLTELRDTLLPELISGELQVDEAIQQVEDVA